MNSFTHLDENGAAVMVDVGGKSATPRRAVAEGFLYASRTVLDAILSGGTPKGDVPAAARIAGIMAAKRTGELVPLCHPIALTHCGIEVAVRPEHGFIRAVCTAQTVGPTGVEMEALTGVSVALLTVYDMCKALDKGMKITDIRLLEKEGGRSGSYKAGEGTQA